MAGPSRKNTTDAIRVRSPVLRPTARGCVVTMRGMPVHRSGNFADVYEWRMQRAGPSFASVLHAPSRRPARRYQGDQPLPQQAKLPSRRVHLPRNKACA